MVVEESGKVGPVAAVGVVSVGVVSGAAGCPGTVRVGPSGAATAASLAACFFS